MSFNGINHMGKEGLPSGGPPCSWEHHTRGSKILFYFLWCYSDLLASKLNWIPQVGSVLLKAATVGWSLLVLSPTQSLSSHFLFPVKLGRAQTEQLWEHLDSIQGQHIRAWALQGNFWVWTGLKFARKHIHISLLAIPPGFSRATTYWEAFPGTSLGCFVVVTPWTFSALKPF